MRKLRIAIDVLAVLTAAVGFMSITHAYTHPDSKYAGGMLVFGFVLAAAAAGGLIFVEAIGSPKRIKSSLTPQQLVEVEAWGCSADEWNKVVRTHNIELIANHFKISKAKAREMVDVSKKLKD